jgi:hypothetical protein
MPNYEFGCESCKENFEVRESSSVRDSEHT